MVASRIACGFRWRSGYERFRDLTALLGPLMLLIVALVTRQPDLALAALYLELLVVFGIGTRMFARRKAREWVADQLDARPKVREALVARGILPAIQEQRVEHGRNSERADLTAERDDGGPATR